MAGRAPVVPLLAAVLLSLFAIAAPSLAVPDAKPKGDADTKLAEEAALRKDTRKVADKFAEKLAPVVKFAVSKGLKDEAGELLAVLKKNAPEYKKLADLEQAVADCGPPADATKTDADKKELAGQTARAYDAHAKDLVKLGMSCVKFKMYARAFDLVNQVLDFDPDNREARQILGYQRHPNDSKKWITKFEAQVMRDGAGLVDEMNPKGSEKTAHVLFVNADGKPECWIPKKDLSQWQKGLRPFAHTWATEEQETKGRRRNEEAGWIVESEHFRIRTTISRAAAYEFGWELLEDYYTAFLRHYFNFFEADAGAQLLFDVKDKNKAPKKHVVLLFPKQEDYESHVKDLHGASELLLRSAGFYTGGGDRCSHFFAVADRSRTLEVLYHEVAHQLFEETKSSGRGSEGNNWVPEGTAMYSETWAKVNGRWIPGYRKDVQGLREMKKYLAQDQSFSLASFIAIDHKEFHDPARRTFNYFMAQALSYFLMQYDDERYKEDFVQFIRAYYEGKVKANSLPDYIQVEGTKDAQKRLDILGTQFKEFMSKL